MHQLMEPLESRRLFAIFNGTPGADTIVAYVDNNGISHVVVNGVDQMTFDFQLDINGHGGDDFIEVRGVHALTLVAINAGTGENTIYIGGGDFDSKVKGNVQVSGHLGHDRIVVYDHQDGSNDFDYYELTSFSFRKPTSTSARLDFFSVKEFEVHGSPQSDAIKIISTAPGTYTTWRSGNGDDIVYVGDGDLGLLKGTLQVSTESGNDQVILYDHLSAGPHTYDIYNQTIECAGFGSFDMNSAESFVLSASAGDDIIHVRTGSGAIAPVSIYGNGGHDTINVHTYAYSNTAPQKTVYLDGGIGSDTINFNTQSGQRTYTVRPTELSGTFLPTYNYATTETLNVNGGSGDETYIVYGTRAGVSTVLNAGPGDDAIWLGGVFNQSSTLDDIDGMLTIHGDAGSDAIEFIDTSHTLAQTFSINTTTVTRTDMADVAFATAEHLIVHGGIAGDTFNVDGTSPATAVFLLGNGGIDVFNVNETASGAGGAVTIDGGAHPDHINVNLDGTGTAGARFNTLQDLLSLRIGAGGLAMLDDPINDQLLHTRMLTIAPGGLLDLGDDAMVLDYTPSGGSPAADVRAWLASGRNGGAWNGTTGITSSAAAVNPRHAVGYCESAELLPFLPSPFPHVDPTTLLLRYTLDGDANLDGAVNLADFNRLAASFGQAERFWHHGDFNFDGAVNLADFNLLAANFGGSITSPRWRFDLDVEQESLV